MIEITINKQSYYILSKKNYLVIQRVYILLIKVNHLFN